VVPALESNGHSVSTRASLSDARKALELDPFDVVLCANILPDGSGLGLCEWLKNNPELPEISRVSFGLVTTGSVDATPPQIAAFDSNKSIVEPRSRFGFGKRRAEIIPIAPTPEQATIRPPFFQEPLPPDDVLFKSISLVDLVLRVQILLRVKRYLDEIAATVGALMQIAEGIEEQDKRAHGHCKRLAIMVLELGSAMGCDDWQLTALERAAYLHDIGKAVIPGAIISKSEALTPREMQIMQSHCLQGERLCRSVAALKPVLPIIRHHHERVNGSGYPDALRGADIPILAQILTIPDIYDALRMWRPYRPPMTQAQAITVMQQEVLAGLWNRQIFEVFASQVLPGLDERLATYDALWPPA
jgi:putative two-component system response regulator